MNRIQRTAATLAMPAVLAAAFVFVAAQSPAEAAPNVETVLPADGVLSIERSGDDWTVTTESVPSEVKVMEPVNAPLCGVNYADTRGLCTTTTTLTLASPCIYLQVDGIVGHKSSDPYVCRPGGTPSTPTPSPSSTPTPTPTSTPEPTSTPSPTPEPLPTPSTSSPTPTSAATRLPASTDSPAPTVSLDRSRPAPDQLAATGLPKWLGVLVLVAVPSLIGLGVWLVCRSKRWSLPPTETQAEMTERYWRQGHEDHV